MIPRGEYLGRMSKKSFGDTFLFRPNWEPLRKKSPMVPDDEFWQINDTEDVGDEVLMYGERIKV